MATILVSANQEELIASKGPFVGKGKAETRVCLGKSRGHRSCISISHKKRIHHNIMW